MLKDKPIYVFQTLHSYGTLVYPVSVYCNAELHMELVPPVNRVRLVAGSQGVSPSLDEFTWFDQLGPTRVVFLNA